MAVTYEDPANGIARFFNVSESQFLFQPMDQLTLSVILHFADDHHFIGSTNECSRHSTQLTQGIQRVGGQAAYPFAMLLPPAQREMCKVWFIVGEVNGLGAGKSEFWQMGLAPVQPNE